jgi:2-polyprenyl-6-methoxyphenol hydroxylase-like FAD-dependent oxidoreductase
MAGLLAARVLAEQDAEVHVLDRDDLTDDGARRRGVPQGRHIHALLPRGRQVLDELFPGLSSELVSAGAPTGDLLGDARVYLGGHRLCRHDSHLTMVSVSRPFLEAHVRARVRQLPNVVFGPACDVLGLVGSAVRCTGVRVVRRADGSAEEIVGADLVVDATGRGSRLPAWLEVLGSSPPIEDRIGVDLGYASRRYRLPSDALDGDVGTLQGPTPDLPRGGALARLEGGVWIVTLFGLGGDHPPTDPDGFVGFARSLRHQDLPDALAAGGPIDDPVGFRFPASVRRRYERLRDLPAGVIPIGDALCSLDPVYGQGMTVAGLGALVLRDHLRRPGGVVPRRFVADLADVVDPAWETSSGGDLAIPTVEGRRTAKVRIGAAYIARLHAAASVDPDLAAAFARVMALVDPPTTLFRPRVVAGVLRGRRRASDGGDGRDREFVA